MADEKRFAISALSKERHAEAYNEEILVDKKTGEFLIKTQYGDVISYNYNSRYRMHLNSIRNDANLLSVYGDIYLIPFMNKELPTVIGSGNLLGDNVFIPGHISSMIIHPDFDSLLITPDAISMNRCYLNLTITFSIMYSDGTESEIKAISTNTMDICNQIIDFSDVRYAPDETKVMSGVVLRGFIPGSSINAKGEYLPSNVVTRHILNSLFVIVEAKS